MNADPVSACLADCGLVTIMHDPNLGMESSKSTVNGGSTPFMAPELLVPSRFGLDKCTSSKEADIYAMAMVIYQVPDPTRCPTYTHANSLCVGTHWNTTIW